MKVIPVVGEKLAIAASIASLVKSYINKEYPHVPLGTIIASVSALAYFVSPIDLIPDVLPVAGYLDDAAVIAACFKLIDSDLTEYIHWRKENGKEIEV